MSNRLAGETSPYLLQHADNPVDWHPWGEEALALARREGKPMLLSIGYSACHWCHVMAHESFEDPSVAAVMNRLFVNIKVDREERPDLDQVYQSAHQVLTGRPGGWPLTLFLSHDGTPFFGGTYFPKTPRHGLPAFPDICERVAEIFRDRPEAVAGQNRSLKEILAETLPQAPTAEALDGRPIEVYRSYLLQTFDARHGGFGGAPKFPHPTDLAFLLRRGDDAARAAAVKTLVRMAEGGLYDQLAGGFCRYSVDERWEIPHFEKMLYDNALLLGVYADAWALTGEPLFARVVEETAAWVRTEMQLPDGGFASALDADSEGEEGRFYVWEPEAVRALLTAAEWRAASRHWGLDRPPNFENSRWHLRVAAPLAPDEAGLIASARRKLLAARALRVRPGLDDKVLASWNALMVEGLIRAARIFDRGDWLADGRRALDFLRAALWREGRLLATWRGGRGHLPAYLDDHAFLLTALLESLQAGFRSGDLAFAVDLADTLLARFEDRAAGGFHFTAHDHEALILRPKSAQDNSLPAGNAVAARALGRLGALLGNSAYLDAADRTLRLFWPQLAGRAGGVASLLTALEEALAAPRTVILRGPPAGVEDWAKRLARRGAGASLVLPLPNGLDGLPPPLAKPGSDEVNAWVCSGVSCRAPVDDFADLERILQEG